MPNASAIEPIPPPDPDPPRHLHRDVLLGFVILAVAAAGMLWWSSNHNRETAASSMPPSTVPALDCDANPRLAVKIVPVESGDDNARIELVSRDPQPVTVTELFLRSPTAVHGGGTKSALAPPSPAVVDDQHPYAWNVHLPGPVAGTILGTNKPPWGVNVINLTWVSPNGEVCRKAAVISE